MTDSQSHLVFVYGTLKKGEPNYEQMINEENGSAVFVGEGRTVNKYPLVVGTEYNVPFLMKLENQGHNVAGEVYEVDNKMLAALDEFEFVPTLYQRHETAIRMTTDVEDGEPSEPAGDAVVKNCGVYFLAEVHEELLKQKWLPEYRSVSDLHGQYVQSEDLSDMLQLSR